MKEQPNYYSIIPATVRYDDKLKANEKLLYGEITALANKNGYCWAENNYFAKLYDVHKITVSNWISNLEKQGYISIQLEYVKGTKQVSKRYIYLNDSPTPINEKANRYKSKDLQGISEKTNAPISEKTKEELNITSTNITSINKGDSDKQLKKRFENLWKLYPEKKGSKKTAFNSYKKAIKDGTTDQEIKDGISNYKNHLGKNSWLKAAYGSTWFNQERWKDEYEETSNERNWEEWDFLG